MPPCDIQEWFTIRLCSIYRIPPLGNTAHNTSYIHTHPSIHTYIIRQRPILCWNSSVPPCDIQEWFTIRLCSIYRIPPLGNTAHNTSYIHTHPSIHTYIHTYIIRQRPILCWNSSVPPCDIQEWFTIRLCSIYRIPQLGNTAHNTSYIHTHPSIHPSIHTYIIRQRPILCWNSSVPPCDIQEWFTIRLCSIYRIPQLGNTAHNTSYIHTHPSIHTYIIRQRPILCWNCSVPPCDIQEWFTVRLCSIYRIPPLGNTAHNTSYIHTHPSIHTYIHPYIHNQTKTNTVFKQFSATLWYTGVVYYQTV